MPKNSQLDVKELEREIVRLKKENDALIEAIARVLAEASRIIRQKKAIS
ncbi:MAG TPA: hypothetical protein VFF25_02855 [Clostridia bacterium]|nr:hypothetical protein [Clostridia bacterium]